MFKTYQHVLPLARAWRTTTDKALTRFFKGLGEGAQDVRSVFDDTFDDLAPATTRNLAEYEKQFGLSTSGLSEQQRRDRLDAAWKAQGGQSPGYLQAALQAAGFDVYVHEWWDPITEDARSPFAYLWDGVAPRQYVGSGHDLAYCGGDLMFSNSQDSPPGYPLVNKLVESGSSVVGAGSSLLFAGGLSAAAGALAFSRTLKQYEIPADTNTYPYYLYIGGEAFPEQAVVLDSRRNEFEALCLKICPTQLWLGILVTYT